MFFQARSARCRVDYRVCRAEVALGKSFSHEKTLNLTISKQTLESRMQLLILAFVQIGIELALLEICANESSRLYNSLTLLFNYFMLVINKHNNEPTFSDFSERN